MSIPLAPDENVFYPMPYVEGEPHLLVITNQRVVHFGDEGKQEMPARQIQFVGRLSTRPLVALGVVLALLALGLAGFGVYLVITSGLLASAKAVATAPVAGDDPSQPQPEEGAAADDPSGAPAVAADAPSTGSKVGAVAATVGGLVLLLVGALMTRVQRHFVLLRGGPMAMQIRAKDPVEQTQILATVGALQSSAKGAPAPAAPAQPEKKKVEVDDKGDPVKALQDLAAARAAGKVSDDEFDEKREILLARVRNRR